MFTAQKSENAAEADAQVVTDPGYSESESGSLCRNGGKYDRGPEEHYRSGSRSVSVCHDQSGNHEEAAPVPDGGRLPVAGRCETLHEIQEIEVDYLDSNFRKQHGKYTS